MLHTIERLPGVDFGPWAADWRGSHDVAEAIIATMPDHPTIEVTNALLQMAVAVHDSEPGTFTARNFNFAFVDDAEAVENLLWGWEPRSIILNLFAGSWSSAAYWRDDPARFCAVEVTNDEHILATNLAALRDRAWSFRGSIASDWADLEEDEDCDPFRSLATPRCVDFRRLTRHAGI